MSLQSEGVLVQFKNQALNSAKCTTEPSELNFLKKSLMEQGTHIGDTLLKSKGLNIQSDIVQPVF